MKVEFILGIGCGGVRTVREVEIDDDATDREIRKELDCWMREHIYLDYRIVEEKHHGL